MNASLREFALGRQVDINVEVLKHHVDSSPTVLLPGESKPSSESEQWIGELKHKNSRGGWLSLCEIRQDQNYISARQNSRLSAN